MDASIKNITVADICAKIEGILRLTMSQSFSLWVIIRPSRIYDSSSSLFLTFFMQTYIGHKITDKAPNSQTILVILNENAAKEF